MRNFKAVIVELILEEKREEALKLLANEYGVKVPRLKVGLPKGRKKALGCYDSKSCTISVLDSDTLKEPFVILHEFYHHLRTSVDAQHRGTEKYANRFAQEFLREYVCSAKRVKEK